MIRQMKLVTWNVQWCRGVDGRVDPSRIARAACAFADFDVLCLQEVAVHFSGLAGSAGEDQMEALSAALPGYTPVFGVATDLSEVGGRTAPVRQRGVHAAAGAAGVPPSAALACRSGGAEHAARGAGGRAGIWDGPLRVISTHLEYYSAHQRAAQVETRTPPALRRLHAGQIPAPWWRRGQPLRSAPASGLCAAVRRFQFPARRPEYRAITARFDDELTPALLDAWTCRIQASRTVDGGAL